MLLDEIGFYTLSAERARSVTATSPLKRCEILVTSACNFRCTYCRGVDVNGHIPREQALKTLDLWCNDGLENIRFSGGEPMLYPHLLECVRLCYRRGVKRIAVSTNGSAPFPDYMDLLRVGVNDFSISLDACCAADGDAISRAPQSWGTVTANIERLARYCYTTVGVVLHAVNVERTAEIIDFAASLGVADIRIIPAAQESAIPIPLGGATANGFPILKYRLDRFRAGLPVRGIPADATNRCPLVLDDMAVIGDKHYPCIIALREGCAPIGTVGPDMRQERNRWYQTHDTHADPICKNNCLDVCVAHNSAVEATPNATE